MRGQSPPDTSATSTMVSRRAGAAAISATGPFAFGGGAVELEAAESSHAAFSAESR